MTLYCGIDQGKFKSNLYIINDNKDKVSEFSICNDIKKILKTLSTFNEDIHFVVESSQTWYWLVDGLTEAGYKVTLAHTFKLAMIRSAKVKTDRRDSKILAEMLLGGFIPEAYIYPKEERNIRDLIRYRVKLVRKRSEEYVDLHMLTTRHGWKSFTKNEIKEIDDDMLEDIFNDKYLRTHVKQDLERIALLSVQIDIIESKIHASLEDDDVFKRLLEIPGLGLTLAATIKYETGEINRFQSLKKFSSYCRVVPGIAQSGGVSRRGRGSKQGNPYLKSSFMQGAVAATRCYDYIKDYFNLQQSKHKGSGGKMICYNIIAHKLATAVYQVMKNGRNYDPELLFGSVEHGA